MGEIDVVSAAHDDVQSGGTRYSCERLRVACESDGCDVDDGGSAGEVKLTRLLDGGVDVEHLMIVSATVPVVSDPPEVFECHGFVHEFALTGFGRFYEGAEEVDEQVLVCECDADFGRLDRS